MKEYEVLVETINPCGGAKHSNKEFIEVETDNPENYVKENGQFPIMETLIDTAGDTVIITGDGNGYIIRYTFTE